MEILHLSKESVKGQLLCKLWEELRRSDAERVYRTHVVIHKAPDWKEEDCGSCELITTNQKIHLRLGRISAIAQVIMCIELKRLLFKKGGTLAYEHLQLIYEGIDDDSLPFRWLVTPTLTREGPSFHLSPA